MEAITEFLGTAAEEQRATHIRLERLEEKVDRRFDALTDTLQGFQSLAAQQAQTTCYFRASPLIQFSVLTLTHATFQCAEYLLPQKWIHGLKILIVYKSSEPAIGH